MTNKNTIKEARKTRENFSLIKLIRNIFFLVGVIIFIISVVTTYKTYTGSEIVKADVINVSGTKNGMLDVEYKYSYDGEKYEESAKQSVGEVKAGDEKGDTNTESSLEEISLEEIIIEFVAIVLLGIGVILMNTGLLLIDTINARKEKDDESSEAEEE